MSSAVRSRIMRAVRSRWTRQERVFASLAPAGWERGGRAEGNADFVYRAQRVAVFLDGDFWHGRRVPDSLPEPWKVKLARNAERDRAVREGLEARGWAVLSYWESDFLADPRSAVREVVEWMTRRADCDAEED